MVAKGNAPERGTGEKNRADLRSGALHNRQNRGRGAGLDRQRGLLPPDIDGV